MTSARTGSNVESAFLDLVERAVAFSDQQDKAAAAAGAAAVGVRGEVVCGSGLRCDLGVRRSTTLLCMRSHS